MTTSPTWWNFKFCCLLGRQLFGAPQLSAPGHGRLMNQHEILVFIIVRNDDTMHWCLIDEHKIAAALALEQLHCIRDEEPLFIIASRARARCIAALKSRTSSCRTTLNHLDWKRLEEPLFECEAASTSVSEVG